MNIPNVKRYFFIAITLFFTVPIAHSAITLPDCAQLEEWSKAIPIIRNVGRSNPDLQLIRDQEQQAILDEMHSDLKIIPLFKRPFSQWNQDETRQTYSQIRACSNQANLRGDEKTSIRLMMSTAKIQFKIKEDANKPNQDMVAIKTPDCAMIENWGLTYYDRKGGTKAQSEAVFSSVATTNMFGLPYNKWQKDDFIKSRDLINQCYRDTMGDTSKNLIQRSLQALRAYLNKKIANDYRAI